MICAPLLSEVRILAVSIRVALLLAGPNIGGMLARALALLPTALLAPDVRVGNLAPLPVGRRRRSGPGVTELLYLP